MPNSVIRITDNPVRDMSFTAFVVKNSNLSTDDVLRATAYNVITPLQLSILTNRSISAIQNLMRPKQTMNGLESELTKVFPFQLKDEPGPAFVLFDEKCKNYITKTLMPDNDGRTSGDSNGKKRPPAHK